MNKTVFIFKPDCLIKTWNKRDVDDDDDKDGGYLIGKCIDGDFYITSNKLIKTIDDERGREEKNNRKIIGYYGNKLPKDDNKLKHDLFVNSISGEVILLNLNLNLKSANKNKIVPVTYNYEAFNKSELLLSNELSNKHFTILNELIKEEAIKEVDKRMLWNGKLSLLLIYISSHLLNVTQRVNGLFKYSVMFKLWEENAFLFNRMLIEYRLRSFCGLSLKIKNAITCLVLNVFFGIVVSYFVLRHVEDVINLLKYSAELIIAYLRNVLTVLMGSPAGLKLNYAFNNALGSFFFFHIDLWKAFVQAIKPLLLQLIHLFVDFGVFGLTFQIAFLADFISLATFHVYCIYVYAARLYWIQIKALTSLWRLFIGRKFNPLRERVDSCVYTHHQLFIGTLGFTVCLFLLPTTLLYYSVFTILRIGLIFVQFILIKLMNIVGHLPLYITILWMFNAPSVAGSFYVCHKDWKNKLNKKQDAVVTAAAKASLFVTLKRVSYLNAVKSCAIDNSSPSDSSSPMINVDEGQESDQREQEQMSFAALIHKAFVGKLL